MMLPNVLFLLLLAVLVLIWYVLLPYSMATQARRRGYSLLAWLIAGALSNSIFLLILLGILPDFRRKRQRAQEMKDLEERLLEASQHVGGRATAAATAPLLDRSLGDQPTILPPHSLGDEVTRG
jgi:hypothetical protein